MILPYIIPIYIARLRSLDYSSHDVVDPWGLISWPVGVVGIAVKAQAAMVSLASLPLSTLPEL